MRLIILFLSATLLVSCFSSKEVRQKKRAQRLLGRAVRLDPSIAQRDTVISKDTVQLPPNTIIDTFLDPNVLCDSVHDTIVIKSVNRGPKVTIRETDQGLQVEAECPVLGDTISFDGIEDGVSYDITIYPKDSVAILDINVSHEKLKMVRDNRTFWQKYGPWLFGLVVFFIIGFILGVKYVKR